MSAPPGHRLRGWVAGVLVVVAGVLFPVSAVAYWANSSVLDEARFTAAVGPLAADPQVRASVSGALSSRVADVLRSGELVDQLPPALRPLGKQLADAVGQQLESAVTAVVSSDAFATAWTEANSKAQRSLVASLRGDDSGAVTAQGSQIVLDTGVFVQQLRDRLATGDLAVLAQVPLPERLSQQIVLVDTPQLENLVDAYPRVEPVAPWLIFAVLGLFAVAVVVAVRRLLVVGGRQRDAVRRSVAVLDQGLVAVQVKRDDDRAGAVGRGKRSVSQPRAVSRSAACCSCGSGGASSAASFPSTCVCACSVSQVALHASNGSAVHTDVIAAPVGAIDFFDAAISRRKPDELLRALGGRAISIYRRGGDGEARPAPRDIGDHAAQDLLGQG